MPRATSNGIEIEYEVFGDPEDVPLLLVNGLGGQLISYNVELCQGFVDRGFYVIRFDNRDVGLSTKVDAPDIDLMEAVATTLAGGTVETPYCLDDMALDAWGLLDALGIHGIHLFGQSLGGMIVQSMAILQPERVLSLTSIMSTTGDADVGQPHPEAVAALLTVGPDDREGAIEHSMAGSKAIGSPEYFDEEYARARATAAYDRCFYPKGTVHQLLAVVTAPSRSDALRALDIEALVIHGSIDPLIDVSGGERTAECLRGSELLVLENMGHDLPHEFWAAIISAVLSVATRGEARTSA